MQEIAEFNPKEAELRSMVQSFDKIEIAGIDDKEGYKIAHEARMKLRATRVEIEKTGKALREEAVQRQKGIIALEKALVAIIEPVEERLHKMELEIDEQIEREKRRALLPERIAKLAEIEYLAVEEALRSRYPTIEDQLIDLTPEQFSAFFNAKKEEYLNRKEAALKSENERMEAEKRAEQERKDAAARAEQDERDRQAREERHRQEVKAAEEASAQRERERIEREAKEKAERQAREQADIEKKKKYQAFLKKNGVDGITPNRAEVIGDVTHTPLFTVASMPGGRLALYKHVDTFDLS